jgi:ribosomal-protein-alanine N-acetyltransferase
MRLELTHCVVRSWRLTDAPDIAPLANNRKIWRNLRDAFPHPYTEADATRWLTAALSGRPETMFAIALDGRACGSIGFALHSDVERVSAEIGYWLGEPYWGRGIVSEALAAVTRYAVQTHGLTRVDAAPYAWNAASCRVLEKAGYTREARLRRAAIKDGEIIDKLLYAWVVPA